MGHLPIVNQDTINDVIRDGYVSTRGDLKEMWGKTTADIFSDMLATRKGDLVFPWIIASKRKKNVGFKYVFRIEGSPIFVRGEEYPIKVPLSTEGWEYENPLPEASALELWDPKLLWNAIGKKSLRRGRSLTHQTPMEDKRLDYLLNSMNPSGPRQIKLGKTKYASVPITIDPTRGYWDPKLLSTLEKLTARERLSQLDLNGVPWRDNNLFNVEKSLEAWVMENIDKAAGQELRDNILNTDLEIEWFGNYLPYGVAGSNMDVVIIQSGTNRKLATIIELKVGSLPAKDFIDAAKQVLRYLEFIKNAFKAFGESVKTKGFVISGPSYVRDSDKSSIRQLKVDWITYHIDASHCVCFEHFLP